MPTRHPCQESPADPLPAPARPGEGSRATLADWLPEHSVAYSVPHLSHVVQGAASQPPSWQSPWPVTHQALLGPHQRAVDTIHLVIEAAGIAQVVASPIAAPEWCGQGTAVDTLTALAGELLQEVGHCRMGSS